MDALQWMGAVRMRMFWSGVDYCDVCISCLDSHSDGTHSLQSIHCWASDGMIHFSKSDEETNSSTSLMEYIFSSFFIFRWTSPLTTTFTCYKSILYISSGSWFWLDGCWFHFGFFCNHFHCRSKNQEIKSTEHCLKSPSQTLHDVYLTKLVSDVFCSSVY